MKMQSLFSTPLAFVLLLLPVLVLMGARCHGLEGPEESLESVGTMEGRMKQEQEEIDEGEAVQNEIMRNPTKYFKKEDDEEGKRMRDDDAEKGKEESERMKMADGKKKTKHHVVKKTENQPVKVEFDDQEVKEGRKLLKIKKAENGGRQGGSKKIKAEKSSKKGGSKKIKTGKGGKQGGSKKIKAEKGGKKGGSKKIKKMKLVAKKPNKKKLGNGKKSSLRRNQRQKENNEVDDDKKPVRKVKKGAASSGNKGRKQGGGKKKSTPKLDEEEEDMTADMTLSERTIETTKKHPIFNFQKYLLADCGQTYKLTPSSAFLFTTDAAKISRNCHTTFQSPSGTTIRFFCPVFSISLNRCKKESVIVMENKSNKWQFCKTDIVDIETTGNSLTVHHQRKRMARKKCPGAFLCEISLGAANGPVPQKPVHPVRPPHPGPGPVYPVPPPHPGPGPVYPLPPPHPGPGPVYPLPPPHPGPGPVYPVPPPHPGPPSTPKPAPIYPGPPVIAPVRPPPPAPQPPRPPAPSGDNRPFCDGCSPMDITITRIVGGADAGVKEFPFLARLDIGPGTLCGGSLITADWIVTASHCYSSGFRTTYVILGDHDRTVDEPHSQKVNAISVIKHKDHDPSSMVNDIALLKLEYPVRFTDFVAPICLSSSKDVTNSRVSVAAGWGHTQYSGYVSNVLQKVVLDIITNSECQDMYITKYLISQHMLCTYSQEKDACQGDSGGPLVVKGTDGKWVLAGITSFGYKCAYANSPGVFTRVADYVQWIGDNIGRPTC